MLIAWERRGVRGGVGVVLTGWCEGFDFEAICILLNM